MNRAALPRPSALGALLLLAAALPATAQVSTEVRLCLQDYAMLSRSGEAEAALEKLRGCAKDHPDVFALQKTLGKKLAELHADTGSTALAEEAVTALQAAERIDSGKFVSLLGDLAGLQQALGREDEAIATWERALPHLMISEKQDAEDRLWTMYRDAGEDEKALALWSTVSYRQTDAASVAYAAGLMKKAGRLDDAKDLYKRALEDSPEDEALQAAYTEILAETAASGGSADKNDLLDAWLPKLGEADDEFLGQLMQLTRDVLRPDAEAQVAREMLKRDPDNAQANLSLGEAMLSEGDEAGGEKKLKAALAGGLSKDDQGRAHSQLGRLAEQRTYARYAAAGSKVGKAEINAAMRGYDEALSHYRKAAAAGADVEDEIANVTRAKSRLGQGSASISDLETEAAKKACDTLSKDARYGYDRDKPLMRTVKSESPLSGSAGGAGDPGNALAGGSEVALMDADWSGGTCWVKVKAADGRQGWLKQSRVR